MNPISFTVQDGYTQFKYDTKELKAFLLRGREHGDCGWIIVKREGRVLHYLGFGTIEHPSKNIHRISMLHFEPFDGEMPTDEERCLSVKKSEGITSSYSFMMLDMSKDDPFERIDLRVACYCEYCMDKSSNQYPDCKYYNPKTSNKLT